MTSDDVIFSGVASIVLLGDVDVLKSGWETNGGVSFEVIVNISGRVRACGLTNKMENTKFYSFKFSSQFGSVSFLFLFLQIVWRY